ncbi:MAG: HAD-IC family P-type ATPase [Candidatus Pacebacteria bacterium]|nr:HAD-IC family P-type ATPase [Candidatus Paceibacterota bacterium]
MATNRKWWSFSADKVLTILRTDRTTGLNQSSLEKLQKRHGLNELPKEKGFFLIQGIIRQIKSPLSLVLIIAGFATLFLREYLDTMVIFIAVGINIFVGVLQEGKAAKVFEALEKSQEKHATVIRNGKQQVVLANSLVPGDIVVLQGGASIPADIRLLEIKSLAVNESALTGEWLPVEKIATSLGRALPVAEQKNMVWMGTLIAEGSGVGVVVATGSDARFGQIAKSTQEAAPAMTPLQKSIRRIARFLMGMIGVALLVILILGLLRGEPLTDILLLAIAVAVAAMPEGLPAAVTVVLAIGMESILRKGGLVKNLLAAETLGSTTVILTDKTGTLTQGRMLMSGLYTAQNSRANDISATGDNKELLRMSVLASDAFVEEDPKEAGKLIVHGRPLEKAITEAGLEAGVSQVDLFMNGYERIDFVQFESSRRYAISLNNCPQRGNRLYLSGSPEHLLARSDKYFLNGRERKLDEKTRKMFADTQARISAEGMRFTAVAYMKITGDSVPDEVTKSEGGKQFVFAGLLAFADAVRPDVPNAIKQAKRAGTRVIMVTGDYSETARAIARETGIDKRENAPVLTGVMIGEMDDKELLQALTKHKIVARVLPEQKLRVARLLRNSGEVVAMTGDGVNDAPALAAADIGIAVGSGTEVAKAAADLILIDNSFSVITAAIAEGRRVIANLRKIVTFLLSTSFSEIIVISGALAFGAPLPLLPTQILWANIVGEGFMSFPFAFEPKEKGIMDQRPEKRGVQSILTKKVKLFIFMVSAITGALLLGLFFLLLWGGVAIDKIRTVVFVALSISSMFYAFSFKDLSRPIWKIPIFSNKYLLGALAASFGLLVAALTFSPLQKLLSLTSLSVLEILVLIALGFVNLLIVEIAKILLHKHVQD